MNTDPLATPSDVEDVWRPLTDTETSRVENLIAKASAKLRQACPFDVDDRIAQFNAGEATPTALDPQIVADLVATIVKRFLVNPEGAVTSTDTTGPLSHSRSFVFRYDKTGADTRGTIQVTDADVDQLRPAVPAPVASSFSYNIPAPQILVPGDRTPTGRPIVLPDVFPDRGAR